MDPLVGKVDSLPLDTEEYGLDFLVNVIGKTLLPVVGCPDTINFDPLAIRGETGLIFNPTLLFY